MYEIYQSIDTEGTSFREIYLELNLEKEYWSSYQTLGNMLKEDREAAVIMEACNQFFQWYENMLDMALEMKYDHMVRMILLSAHQIYDRCLLPAMCYLQGEERGIQELYRNSVLAGLEAAEHPALIMLKQYAASCKNNRNQNFDALLLLARETVCISRVQRMLLAGNEEDGQEIAYYTALPTFCFLLPGVKEDNQYCGRMSVMHLAYMNDPNEGKILQRYLGMDQLALSEDRSKGGGSLKEPNRKNAAYPYVFMKCFTSLVDDLPMWEMYGDHARGCCIILDRKCLVSKEEKKAIPLYRICYLRKDGGAIRLDQEDNPRLTDIDRLQELLDEIGEGIWLARSFPSLYGWLEKMLEDIVYLFKDADYSHEQEMRILYRFHEADRAFCHTSGEYPLLFVRPEFRVDIKEIIVGPKFEKQSERMPYLTEQVEKMCRATGRNMPKITMSSIEYR